MISSWGNYIFDRIELSYALFDTLQSNIYTRDKFQNRIQKNTNIGVIVCRFVNNFPCCKSFLISPKDIFESVYWKYYSLNCIITKYNIDNKVQSPTWSQVTQFSTVHYTWLIKYENSAKVPMSTINWCLYRIKRESYFISKTYFKISVFKLVDITKFPL